MFQNAQTYFKNLDYNQAIEEYEKIIKDNNNEEEVWYSLFQLAKINLLKGDLNKAQNLVMKSYNLNNKRSENLYLLTNYYRLIGDNKKAYFFYNLAKNISKPNTGLFIDDHVYDYLLQYELTILHYYISNNRKEGLLNSINYLNLKNKSDESNVYNNLHYYLEPLITKEKTESFK
jgi:tetratricopeptide (TPR) repeat protein